MRVPCTEMRDLRRRDELDEVGEVYPTGTKPGAVSLTQHLPVQRKVRPDVRTPSPPLEQFAFVQAYGGEVAGGGDAAFPDERPMAWMAAEQGTSGSAGPLPHLATIQPLFGKHDVSSTRAYTDASATAGANAMGAEAFAVGDQVAFADAPTLHTAAHEAAHVVQQRAGVALKGAVGQIGDQYERHADAVADKVIAGESAEALLDQMAGSGGSAGGARAIQRRLSPHYADMVARLSYGATDWAITDAEAHQVLVWLQALSPADFTDTVIQLNADGKLDRLLSNISTADRTTYATLISNIELEKTRSHSRAATQAHIENLLSYGVLDWAITDDDARQVLERIQALPDDRKRVLVEQLDTGGYYARLIANVSAADRTTYAALLTQLDGYRRGRTDLMRGTSLPGAGAVTAVNTALNAGVTTNPITGAPAAFVDVDPITGHTYRQDIEAALDGVRAWMFTQSSAMMARTRMPMSRFEGVGQEAKRQTDALFGGFASGPAFTTTGPNPNLIDRSLQPPDRVDLVRYLINNQSELLPVHTAHSAIPSRGAVGDMATERGIIQQIITDYSAAHAAELDVIDRGWPAVAGGGVVEIQPFEGATPTDTRRGLWDSFQTMIHEYLHTITHPTYEALAHTLGGTKESILIEGGTSLFTDKVWNFIYPHEIAANDALRLNVEGSAMPFDVSVIPPISHYDQIAEARTIESAVGEENMRAAYFLGHTELLGLGAAYSPAAATRGNAYVVPAAGVATVADVATATGVAAADIAAANGIGAADPVTAGQQLTVPGIRIHTVREGGTETKADIARLNGVSEADLDRANVGFNWAALAPGQSIVIPVH